MLAFTRWPGKGKEDKDIYKLEIRNTELMCRHPLIVYTTRSLSRKLRIWKYSRFWSQSFCGRSFFNPSLYRSAQNKYTYISLVPNKGVRRFLATEAHYALNPALNRHSFSIWILSFCTFSQSFPPPYIHHLFLQVLCLCYRLTLDGEYHSLNFWRLFRENNLFVSFLICTFSHSCYRLPTYVHDLFSECFMFLLACNIEL